MFKTKMKVFLSEKEQKFDIKLFFVRDSKRTKTESMELFIVKCYIPNV